MGSGKSTFAQILRDLGYEVLDADQLARLVVLPGTPAYKEIIRTFGEDIILPDGELDRKALGRKVFGRPADLKKLEKIIHPRIREQTQERRKELARQGVQLAFYEVPLLFEKNLQSLFDGVVCVVSKEEVALQRVMERDQLTEKEAKDRLSHQLPLSQKTSQSDFTIDNSGTIEDLRQNARNLIKTLTNPKSSQN